MRTVLFLFVLAACHPPRIAPPVPPGEWTSTLGGPARAVYASEQISTGLRPDWRKGVDRGLAVALQVHGPIIVATTTGRSVVALNAESGMQYWSRRFGGPVAGTALRRDDRVFVATGDRENRVHALDIRRGRGIWSQRTGPVRVEPLLLDSALIVATEAGTVMALRTADGKVLWRTPTRAAPAIPPVFANGHLYVATQRDTLLRMDAGSGEITAKLALPATPSAPALVAGSRIVVPLHSADVLAIDVSAEPRIEWQTNVNAVVLAAPVRLGDASFVLTRDAEVYRLDDRGAATRIAELDGAATGSFAVVGNRLVAGILSGALYLLDADGNILWQQNLGDSLIAPVAANDGSLYVPLLRGDIVRMR